MTARELEEIVRQAWLGVPAPPEEDMRMMEWGWGEAAAKAFTGVAPVDVDTRSPGFHAATPLLELPHRAAAAYLGTFLISLLQSLDFQDSSGGLFDDLVTRPHTLTMLTTKHFWDEVIRKHLSPERQEVVAAVARFLVSKREALALRQEQSDALLQLASGSGA